MVILKFIKEVKNLYFGRLKEYAGRLSLFFNSYASCESNQFKVQEGAVLQDSYITST